MDNDLEKAKTEILKEKELEIMYSKELAPIDRINFVKQKVEDALKKGKELGAKDFSNFLIKEFGTKKTEESFKKFLIPHLEKIRVEERKKTIVEVDKFLDEYKNWEQYFDEIGTEEGKKVFNATLINIKRDLLKALKKELGDK